jgi:hypothetical protein
MLPASQTCHFRTVTRSRTISSLRRRQPQSDSESDVAGQVGAGPSPLRLGLGGPGGVERTEPGLGTSLGVLLVELSLICHGRVFVRVKSQLVSLRPGLAAAANGAPGVHTGSLSHGASDGGLPSVTVTVLLTRTVPGEPSPH